MSYYDGTKLLSMSDINGKKPEIFICTSNRSAGKTTYFSRLCVNKFKQKGEKFIIIYRFNYELDDCADKFFKDIKGLFFPNDTLSSKSRAKGIYHELFLNDIPCGYAISLNSADQLKKYSHFFSDAKRMMFDEFQSETEHYCDNEVRKLISIHTSFARGQGNFVRYLPVYLISNPVSLVNPYYVEMGISNRLTSKTHFLKGDGFVLEQGFNESASKAQEESAFNRAFSKNNYIAYSTQNVYLNDNLAFVEKVSGVSRYICTIKYENTNYAIREFRDLGIIYCDTSVDNTFPVKLSVTTNDHDINYVMLKANDLLIYKIKYYFNKGCFRFKDLNCKKAILKIVTA